MYEEQVKDHFGKILRGTATGGDPENIDGEFLEEKWNVLSVVRRQKKGTLPT